jgi:hypothetical protein
MEVKALRICIGKSILPRVAQMEAMVDVVAT